MSDDWLANFLQRRSERANHSTKGRYRGIATDGSVISLNVRREFMKALDEACQVTNLSRASYIRRALTLTVAKHIGSHPLALVQLHPQTTAYGGQANPRAGVFPPDDGVGLEAFCPHPDCDGKHLVE